MNLREFLEISVRLEEALFYCYEALAKAIPDEASCADLSRISREELQHVNAIRLGRQYVAKVPDLFGSPALSAAALAEGIALTEALHKDILGGQDRPAQLARLLDLEKRFECVHMDTSVEILEPSLKKLFEDLSREDRTHVEMLTEILSRG